MRKVTLIIYSVIILLPSRAQIPDFVREDLTFILNDSSFMVSGNYYFVNPHNHPMKITLLYPFPQDSTYGEITSVYAYDLENPEENRLRRYNHKAALLTLEINTRGAKILHVGYTQLINSGKAEYILTTTSRWGKPLKTANFELFVPIHLQIDSLTYKPHAYSIILSNQYYKFHYENIMPEVDFGVYFMERR